jgi:hypothetical protein
VPARRPRPALALLAAAVLLAGCGASATSEGGSVSVAVTRDFGRDPVLSSPPVGVRGSTSLTEVLDRVTRTREGGASVTSIDGVAGDWRLFVNGVRVANAATADVRPGDRVWLDLPTGRGVPRTPAVVGGFPEPFVHGVAGKRIPTRVECADPEASACDAVAGRLGDLGVVAARGGINAGVNDESVRVLVGTWAQLRAATRDDALIRMEQGPARSGVYARFDAAGRALEVLAPGDEEAEMLGAGTGLIAATQVEERQPVWFVTGTDGAGVDAAARALDEATLTTKYALAVHDDRGVTLPGGEVG